MANSLVEFWRECPLDKPPYIHPEDLPILREKARWLDANDPLTFEHYLQSNRFGSPDDNRLHLSLFPVPYIGDLDTAEIFILLLNPGFEYSDFWADNENAPFRKRIQQNLRQDFSDTDFPFLKLDPHFCWHSGFMWWEGKLRDIAQKIARDKFDKSYLSALRDLSTKIACIELIPYHSRSFGDSPLINRLPSVKHAKAFVTKTVVPKAQKKECTIIATRQVETWGLTDMDNVICYRDWETRGAHLNIKSRGGQAILKHYEIA